MCLILCILSAPRSTQNETLPFTSGTSNFCWENKCKGMKGFKHFVGMPHAQFEARKSLMFWAWKISLAVAALSSACLILTNATQAKWILSFNMANPGSWADKGEGMGPVLQGEGCKGWRIPFKSPWYILLRDVGTGSRAARVWGQSCAGATELVVPPRSSLPACPYPADNLSRAPETWNLFATESLWHSGVKLLSKRRQETGAKSKPLRNIPPQSFSPRQGTEIKTLIVPNN